MKCWDLHPGHRVQGVGNLWFWGLAVGHCLIHSDWHVVPWQSDFRMHEELGQRKQLWFSGNGGSVHSGERNRQEGSFLLLCCYTRKMSYLTSVESFPLNSKLFQALLLCTVCGCLNGSRPHLNYRRKCGTITVKTVLGDSINGVLEESSTSYKCYSLFSASLSRHLCCLAHA